MNENPEVANLRAYVQRLEQQLAEERGKQQELSSQLAKLQSVVDRVVEASDTNTSAFRDIIQILDAKSCVQEAILRDISQDLFYWVTPLDRTAAKMTRLTANGQLDVEHYFDQWRQKLVEEEAKDQDPYAGAVVFGGDYHAQVDEPPGQANT